MKEVSYIATTLGNDDPTLIPPCSEEVTGPATANNGMSTYQGTGQQQQDRKETQVSGWQVPSNQAVSIFLKPSEITGQWPLPQLAQGPVGLQSLEYGDWLWLYKSAE